MATTLTALRDRVEQILADSSNAIWATGDVDEAIRRALHAYSLVSPQHKITTINIAATSREISTSAITDAITVEEVWCPYTAATPEYPPNKLPFRFWKEAAKLYIQGDYSPVAGTVMRVFYTAVHLLNGLDSASSTTLPPEHDSIIALGAAGHAATSRALDLAEQVTVDRDAVERLTDWGQKKLAEFQQALDEIAVRTTLTPEALDRMATWAKEKLAEFQQALDQIAVRITLTPETLDRMATWAKEKLAAFEADLRTIAVQAQGPGHVPLPALDRHDNTWA